MCDSINRQSSFICSLIIYFKVVCKMFLKFVVLLVAVNLISVNAATLYSNKTVDEATGKDNRNQRKRSHINIS